MANAPQHLIRPTARNLLCRVLDQPNLPEQIQSLPPAVLGHLVDRIGLEDSGELVALATTEQLAQLFDDDLWKNERPGEEEKFDSRRFLLWLEVMLEAGESFVAQRLIELPEDLVTLAFHRHMLVLNLDALAADMQAADEVEARQLDKALESCLYEEVGEYQLMAREPEVWETILTAVLALDKDHHDFLCRVLERCCHMASEYIEDNGGLYEVLTSDEMLECDAAGEREDRRAETGYVSPSAASSFLKLARAGSETAYDEHDVMTRAYFRGLSKKPSPSKQGATARSLSPSLHREDSLLQILAESGVVPEPQPIRLLTAASAQAGALAEPILVPAMRLLREEDPQGFCERSEEIAYLTNALVAGCSFRQRRLRPIEALRAVIATCSLGLWLSFECLSRRKGGSRDMDSAVRALQRLPADGLFRAAWHRLHRDVVDQSASVTLALLERAGEESAKEDRPALVRAAAVLRDALAKGAPWRALSKMDILLGAVESWAVEALCRLMDECPSLPAMGNGKASKDSGQELPRFICSMDELEDVDRLLLRLKGEPSPAPGETRPARAKKGSPARKSARGTK